VPAKIAVVTSNEPATMYGPILRFILAMMVFLFSSAHSPHFYIYAPKIIGARYISTAPLVVEGGSKNFNFGTRRAHSELHRSRRHFPAYNFQSVFRKSTSCSFCASVRAIWNRLS
jgi:hypothetical protein